MSTRTHPAPQAWAGSVAALLASIACLYFACLWHSRLELAPSTDVLLRALPRFELKSLLTTYYFAFHAAVIGLGFALDRPRVPYYLFQVALFVMVRNVCILLTPVGPPHDLVSLFQTGPMALTDHELFFSGHTGLPFLYALMLQRPKGIRAACLAMSVAMAATVLVTRNHYAIDVFGAFFMTFATHQIGRRLFRSLRRG